MIYTTFIILGHAIMITLIVNEYFRTITIELKEKNKLNIGAKEG